MRNKSGRAQYRHFSANLFPFEQEKKDAFRVLDDVSEKSIGRLTT